MLAIREKIKPFVVYKVGNGKDILVWHDKWCSLSPLKSLFTNRDMYHERLDNNAKIVDMVQNGRWNWPDTWIKDHSVLLKIQVPSLNDQVKDKAVWVGRDNKEVKFSTKVVWLSLRDNWPKVQWSHVVRYSQYNPRQAFILWLAIHGRLMTQDRIMKWNQGVDLKFSFCKNYEDSHHHLFFQCLEVAKIWDVLKIKGNLHSTPGTLDRVVEFITAKPFKNNI
ncbi:RNA-directed DNA polymerase, eukaryota, reverse transcriptase zinc-binding domain protein [Tanacetum coccineum]